MWWERIEARVVAEYRVAGEITSALTRVCKFPTTQESDSQLKANSHGSVTVRHHFSYPEESNTYCA